MYTVDLTSTFKHWRQKKTKTSKTSDKTVQNGQIALLKDLHGKKSTKPCCKKRCRLSCNASRVFECSMIFYDLFFVEGAPGPGHIWLGSTRSSPFEASVRNDLSLSDLLQTSRLQMSVWLPTNRSDLKYRTQAPKTHAILDSFGAFFSFALRVWSILAFHSFWSF